MLEQIGGFPLGANYGECIAAEIGVSRSVVAHGMGLGMVGPAPFHVFRHHEWNQDTPGGAYSQKSPGLEIARLREENAALRARLENPTLADLWRALRRRGRARVVK